MGQIITLIWINLAFIGILTTLFIRLMNKLEKNIKDLGNQVDTLGEKLDARMDSQTARTDQLYQMFIDLIKETKK